MSNHDYEILKQFRTPEEVWQDSDRERHDNGDCGGECWVCRCDHINEVAKPKVEAAVKKHFKMGG